MGKLKITDFFIYRYRYLTSVVIIGFILCALLFVSGVLVPGGLSTLEMDSATKSGNLTLGALTGMQPDTTLSLPYRVLQSVSIHLFGVSALSIKLPSLLLAAGSIVFLYGILQLWFRRNVAIITTVITITSSQFLLQSQSGTSGIVYLFWGALLLYVTSKMAASRKLQPLWLILTAISAALALYTPYMLYLIIPLLLAAIIHPHARFVVFRQPLWAIVSSVAVFIICLVPFGAAAFTHPDILLQAAVGKTLTDDSIDFAANFSQLVQYVDFYNNQGGRILQPAFGMGLLLLAVVGLFRLLSAKYTAKSYIMIIWIVLTLPILFINPNVASAAILPVALLSAFAMDLLIRRWYTMFPLNPYARVAGLVPLGILVLVLSVSSMDRFIYGYRYDPDAVAAYTTDVALLRKEIRQSNSSITLVIPENQNAFYSMFVKQNDYTNVTVSSKPISNLSNTTSIVSGELVYARTTTLIPSRIIVSQTTNDANRFYVYEK